MMSQRRMIDEDRRQRREAHGPALPTLAQLRQLSKARQVRVYAQGGGWIKSVWCEGYGAWQETPMHYSYDGAPERIALAAALGV